MDVCAKPGVGHPEHTAAWTDAPKKTKGVKKHGAKKSGESKRESERENVGQTSRVPALLVRTSR